MSAVYLQSLNTYSTLVSVAYDLALTMKMQRDLESSFLISRKLLLNRVRKIDNESNYYLRVEKRCFWRTKWNQKNYAFTLCWAQHRRQTHNNQFTCESGRRNSLTVVTKFDVTSWFQGRRHTRTKSVATETSWRRHVTGRMLCQNCSLYVNWELGNQTKIMFFSQKIEFEHIRRLKHNNHFYQKYFIVLFLWLYNWKSAMKYILIKIDPVYLIFIFVYPVYKFFSFLIWKRPFLPSFAKLNLLRRHFQSHPNR